MIWALGVLGLLLLLALLYWQLIIAEGAYLGRRMVALLYNISAGAYDRIKQYDPGYEQWFLGRPLARALAVLPDPLVLDVATGTARLARTLLKETGFQGRMVGLDYARQMLREAVRTTEPWSDRLTLVWKGASELPFADASFDAVTCLEALEFMPDAEQVLREMVRVLHPGGILVTTNRISKDVWMLPGRVYTPEAFETLLRSLDLEMVQTQPWQEDYDLVWARKSGAMGTTLRERGLEMIVRCPACGGAVHFEATAVVCTACDARYPIAGDGVIEMRT